MNRPDEDEVTRAREHAVAEEVVSLLRHDLRNKLLTVRNATAYLNKRFLGSDLAESDVRIPRFIELIIQELDAVDLMLHANGPAEKEARGEAGVVHVDDIVRAATGSVMPASGVELRIAEATENASAHGNHLDLTLALRAALENAFEASPEGGTVTVETGHDGSGPFIRVSDTGPGMDEDASRARRQPFTSTKPGRLGLGLNVAARRLGRHGGRLEWVAADHGVVMLHLGNPRENVK